MTICPGLPWATSRRAKAWLGRKVPVRFTLITRCHSSKGRSSTLTISRMPAEFTSTSSRPSAASAASTNRAAEAGSATSTWIACASPLLRRISSAVACARCRSRSPTATRAPSLAAA